MKKNHTKKIANTLHIIRFKLAETISASGKARIMSQEICGTVYVAFFNKIKLHFYEKNVFDRFYCFNGNSIIGSGKGQ